MLWYQLVASGLLLPLQLEFGPNAFLQERCHSQHVQSLGARQPQLEEKCSNTLKTEEKPRLVCTHDVLSSTSHTILYQVPHRCSDKGLHRQGRVPHQMPAVLLISLTALPGVTAQAHSTGESNTAAMGKLEVAEV